LVVLKDYRLKLFDFFVKELDDEGYKNKSTDYNPKSFTRSRIFTFKRLIVVLMLLRTSYQREINAFCRKLLKQDYNIRQATAGALTQARAKLNPYAFQRLQQIAASLFYKEAPYIKWKDFRLLAVDGSVLNLPSSPSIIEEFGYEEYVNKSTGTKSMARCSLLYDVMNQVTIDAQLSTYKTSEKVLLEKHLSYLSEGDLVLADRGYAYSSIIYWLSERKVDYCFRFHDRKMKVVKQFLASKKWDKLIDLHLDVKVLKSLNLPKNTPPLKVRLIKVKLDNGNIEVLGTSLINKEKYKQKIFKELYHKRWGVEEAFKLLKSRLCLEDFSGRTARSIYQDFYSKILMMTLCAVLSHPIEQKVRKEYAAAKSGNKYDQQLNKADALAETRNTLISLFLFNCKKKVIAILDRLIIASRCIIRPGRKYERLKKSTGRKPLNYKRI
jgi:hypothetical protein